MSTETPAADGRRRAAAAQVQRHQLQVGVGGGPSSAARGSWPTRRTSAVEAEPADAVARAPAPRGSRSARRAPGAARGSAVSKTATIGTAGLRAARAGADAGQARPVVQRRQRPPAASIASSTASSIARRRREARAAVHDAVADGVHGLGPFGEPFQQALDGVAVVGDRRVPLLDAAVSLEPPLGLGPEPLDRSARPGPGGGGRRAGLDGQQAELHRRRAAVQRQHVHPRASIQAPMAMKPSAATRVR